MTTSAHPTQTSPQWMQRLVQAWRSKDTSRTSLSSTGIVVSALLVVIIGTFAWRHPDHRLEGVLVTLQLAGALLATPLLARKLLPACPILTARRLAGDTSSEADGLAKRLEAAAFRLWVANKLRAGLRSWPRPLAIGATTMALTFLVQAVSVATAVALFFVGAFLALFALYGMLAPRRFHEPLPPSIEIVSPLVLVANPRVEALLGALGLACVLASLAINFVRLYV